MSRSLTIETKFMEDYLIINGERLHNSLFVYYKKEQKYVYVDIRRFWLDKTLYLPFVYQNAIIDLNISY